MKYSLLIVALLGGLQLANAQEQLSREQALQLAFVAGLDLAQLQGTPIPTDVDLKRPIALREGEYGGLFLPEAKLSAQCIAGAGDKVVPIGQLWLHKLTPKQDNQPVYSSKLRMAKVELEGDTVQVPQCTLGVRKTSAGQIQLLVFGKTAEPIVTVPVSTANSGSADGVTLKAERDYSGGTVTLCLFGKYKAELEVTELSY